MFSLILGSDKMASYAYIFSFFMNSLVVFSVTELNARVRAILELEMASVAVTGEISNLVKAASGHYYFTLKDTKAQIKCAFFTNAHRQKLQHELKNGQEVLVYGKISVYEPRGEYQLIVSHVQDTGIGLLYQQFIQLKSKLEALGLFANERKKNLPHFPQKIAIVTSPKGAALHDVLTTIRRRYPIAETIIYPTEVQGKDAPAQIIQALNKADVENNDVILLCRGGGSLEDLWAFNDEQLAYAISACHTPIISGVGHETDFTIADFIADMRAATPTAAAEKATPNQIELNAQIQQYKNRLNQLMLAKIEQYQNVLTWMNRQMGTPEKILIQPWQRFDYAERLLKDITLTKLVKMTHRHQLLDKHLQSFNPFLQMRLKQQRLQYCQDQLQQLTTRYLEKRQQKHHFLTQTLTTLGPKSTLERGYAIVCNDAEKVISNSQNLNIGDILHIHLAYGHIESSITKIKDA